MDHYRWNPEPHRWQDHVLPPGRWKMDLIITMLFFLVLLLVNAGTPSPQNHVSTPAVVMAECAKPSPPPSRLKVIPERCRVPRGPSI